MGNIKEMKIKNWTYYFFDDIINIGDFNPNLLKIDKRLYKNIDIYYNGYITMKNSDYIKKSLNPFYLKRMDTWQKKMEVNTWFLILQIKTKKY